MDDVFFDMMSSGLVGGALRSAAVQFQLVENVYEYVKCRRCKQRLEGRAFHLLNDFLFFEANPRFKAFTAKSSDPKSGFLYKREFVESGLAPYEISGLFSLPEIMRTKIGRASTE